MKNEKKITRPLKRVAMLNPQGYVMDPPPLGKTDTGGQTLYVLQLAKALGRKNVKVDIITRQFDGQEMEEQIAENVKIIRVTAGSSNFVQKEKMYELMPEFVNNFMAYIEKKRKVYDIIHSHYWDGGYAGYLLAKMLDIPHVYTPHSLGKLKKIEMTSAEQVPTQNLKPMYRYHVRISIEQQIMNVANSIVVICETSRIQILQHYLIDFEKLKVIYPGIDTNIFNPTKNVYEKQINMQENSILTISRLVPAKGIDRVIEAVALLKNKVNFHLYIGGDTSEENKSKEEIDTERSLTALIKKHHLDKKITFLGTVPHDSLLPAYYRKASVFILPARYEPFGLTTMEAMASGTAPIVSSIAGSREIIVDGVNGFIIDAHDRKKLSKQIYTLLKDSKLNKTISENAATTVKKNYAWDEIVNQFTDLYKHLLNN